jgi:hypothetical protein
MLGMARVDAFARLNDGLPTVSSLTTEAGVWLCVATLPGLLRAGQVMPPNRPHGGFWHFCALAVRGGMKR